MDEAHARIFGLIVAPALASDAMDCDLRDDEFTYYPDEKDGGD